MTEGTLCNQNPINTKEELDVLLKDKRGQQYYKEMDNLEVDSTALWQEIQRTCKSRIKSWLTICAHCGMCADSCLFYLANDKDPEQVPSFKIQSTKSDAPQSPKLAYHCRNFPGRGCRCFYVRLFPGHAVHG